MSAVRRPAAAAPPPLRAYAALAAVVLLLLLGAAAALVAAGSHLGYATRLAGTPGTLTVRSCEVTIEPKNSHTVCHGVFRSDSGTVVDPGAQISEAATVGSSVPVQRTTEGGYEAVGFAAICGWLTIVLFGLAMVGLAAAAVYAVARGRGRGPKRSVWAGLVGCVALALVCALSSAIAGAVQ